MTRPLTGSDFREVTRDAPCEICLKPDWCRRSDDGCLECHRHTDDVPGYRLLKITASGFGLYRSADQQTPNHARKPVAAGTVGVQNRRNGPGVTSDTSQNEIDPPSPPQRDPGAKSAAFPTVEAAVEEVVCKVGGTYSGEWMYEHADGSPAMVIVRINTPKPNDPHDKTFRPVHPTADGWAIGDPMTSTPNGNGDGLDRLLSVKRVCEVLSTTDRSLRRWVILGLVPKPDVRIGRNLRWKASTIRTLIDSGGNGGPRG